MKKRILSFVITFCVAVALLPVVAHEALAATYSYDVNAALAYAEAHWNDGKGQCAEFVSRCVIAGGLNISVQDGTGPCYRAIGRTTGLAPVNDANKETDNANNLPNLPALVLDSSGNAKEASNGKILQAGDVVIQWCYTHHISPHILICGGYNSEGNATFYAHNSALHNKTYNLARNTSNNHTSSCNMGAKVMHFSASSSGGSTPPTTTAPPAPTGLTASKASENTARVSWNASSGATSYKVEYYSQSAGAWKTDNDYKSGTSYTSTGLSLYNSYRFRVRAVNGSLTSAWVEITYTKPSASTPAQNGTATITYNANGGSGAPGSHSVTKDSSGNAKFTLSSTKPTREGYTFLGWRLNNSTAYAIDSPGQSITFPTGSATSNTTLTYYAQWQAATLSVSNTTNGSYTVTIPANFTLDCYASATATTRSTYISAKSQSYTVYCTQRITMSDGSTRYLFQSGDTPPKDLYFVFTGAMSVATQSQSGTVTIQYNANGGTGAPASHSVTKDSSGVARFTLSSTKPTRSGYTFLGWRLENSAAYAIDSPGQSIAIATGSATSNTTLTYYAQWQASSGSGDPAISSLNRNMVVNVGAGSTLRFCSTVSTADNAYLGSIPNATPVYVYGFTTQQYEGKTWAKISYNGQVGWVNSAWLLDTSGIVITSVNKNMTVNVGAGSTLRFCITVSTGDSAYISSIPNGTLVYVYGFTTQQYESRTWAKISYNGKEGWVNSAWLS